MVVYMVTLYLRVSMRRPTEFSALRSLFRSVTAGAIVLATIVSCSDSTSPTKGLDGVIRVKVNTIGVDVPDSLKQAIADQESVLSAPMSLVANLMAPTSGVSSVSAGAGCSSGGAFAGYNESRITYGLEATPAFAPYPLKPDSYIPASYVPLGFSFNFQGTNYTDVNVFTNGFLLFGAVPPLPGDGFFRGGVIPSSINPNNLIAFAWTDWQPEVVPDGIRYETRGTAPKRRFILEFNNIPEYASTSQVGAIKPGVGSLTAQVVLYEGSNNIEIHTSTMNLTNSNNRYTQGIENAAGTLAMYDTIQNPTTLAWVPRVAKFFTKIRLTEDAVKFSPIATKDEQIPSITAPAAITQGNDPTLASAVVALGSPLASDNCGVPTISSVRSDGVVDITAPFPVGVTTVTWTATDAAGNKASATQMVTVLDIEPPVFPSSIGARFASQSSLTFNATSPSGALVSYKVNATDNVGVTSLLCEPASGTLFPIGNTSVSCTAGDAAGNTTTELFNVHVASADEMLAALLTSLNSLNLPNGTKQPLFNQLKNANGGELSCNKLSDFIGLVGTKQSSVGPATVSLISQASSIMGALGCDGSSAPTLSAARIAN
jgi:HYR domain-containing protein